MLMSNTYTLRQVAKDLQDIAAKKRDVRRTTTQERPAIKPNTTTGNLTNTTPDAS
jgi:hypothetical protein